LVTDQRVRKQCNELFNAGYDVFLLGRMLPGSLVLDREYSVHRARLLFNKGASFYAALNIYLFFKLLFSRCDLLWANDLDTLPANWLVSILRGKKLIYDSHEYFTEVPEIQHRPLIKKTWQFFERLCITHASLVITVSPSIARLLESTYGINEVFVVRNVPEQAVANTSISREDLNLDPRKNILLLQGNGININRGGEELVESMSTNENAQLLIIGNGDAMPTLKRISEELKLSERVTFLPRMPYVEMMRYTAMADVGFSLDKNDNVNYRFSLPNKIFDYAMAGLPMITSNLPEVSSFVKSNKIGVVLNKVTPREISIAVNELLRDESRMSELRENARKVGAQLSWEKEFKPIIDRLAILNA